LTELHGEVVPRSELIGRFETDAGATPLMAAQQGIHKPNFLDAALSFTTAPPKVGRDAPYEDAMTHDGLLLYRYRGRDPSSYDNVAMRLAMQRRAPMIYFYGIEPGFYMPVWPVFIVGDNPRELAFTVAVDDASAIHHDPASGASDARRMYVTRVTLQRMHQRTFRQRVMRAYQTECAMCRLRHDKLLEAAHIIADADPRGLPEVSNGIALCMLHHAAFDRHILGIRPDLVVELHRDLLDEIDGPMLRHGLQELHGSKITVPRRTADQPRVDFLAERYARFRRVG
jgi:putative restriction endonuclease